MARKQKYKTRLDKYYHIAKSQGYRSRACFKLIQLNKKYQFLSNANVVIDLCSAPGGWLQVISKFTPMNSIKIGLDLDPIKPIPGCKTFVQDITTPSCYQLLKRELNQQKADVVLNDGAPNVGANWDKDAYNQNELCLHALKLGCTFLKKGGIFITKVFRSKDYNTLLWVFQKFFDKVEANKPLASRFTSAEIFVVCQGYIAPDIIDDKLFDAKFIFQDTESDIIQSQLKNEVQSIDKIMQKRRKRQGYSDDAPMSLCSTLNFTAFLTTDNPFVVFIEYSKIEMTEEEKKKYLPLADPPQFWDEYLADIQVLGKREIAGLLKWRGKLNLALRKLNKASKQEIDGKGKQIENEMIQESTEKQMEEENDNDWIDEDEEEEEEDDEEEDQEIENDEQVEEEDEEIDQNSELINNKKKNDMEVEEEKNEDQIDNKKQQKSKQVSKKENDTDSELEDEIRKAQHEELKKQRKERQKKLNQFSKVGHNIQFSNNIEDEELFDIFKHKDLNKMDYVEIPEQQKQKQPKIMSFKGTKGLEDNLEQMYLSKQNAINEKKKMKEHNEEDVEFNPDKMKCEGINQQQKRKSNLEANNINEKQQFVMQNKILNKKWFDRQLFQDVKQDLENGNISFKNPINTQTDKEYQKDQLQNGKTAFSKETQFDEEYNSSDQYEDEDEDENEDENIEDFYQAKKRKLNKVNKNNQLQNNVINKSNKQNKKVSNDYSNNEDYNIEYDQQDDTNEHQRYQNDDDDDNNNNNQDSDYSNEQSFSDIYIDNNLLKKRKFNEYQQNIKIDPNEKVPGELSDDDAYKIKKPLSEREQRKLKLKKRREKKEAEQGNQETKDDGFEIVPEKKMEDYDVDSLAETLALAKKMLRKRTRDQIINNSYNRHSVEDQESLPKWFVEDEKKHQYKIQPVTKEEVMQEKERIYAINAKAPKKIMEAKIRRQKRLQKRLKKAKSKANQIIQSEGISENLKMQQISSLYKKELALNKPEKKYVVSKKFNSVKGKKGSRTVKFVDRRLKKDKRADKARIKRDGQSKKLKSKTRQIRRHKGRKQKN